MIKSIYIKNFALIDEITINFQQGFNVISGETGAGKSIMLDGISLILGNRADTTLLNDKSQKCIVEGVIKVDKQKCHSFFLENDLDFLEESIFRREISPNGQSRAFINDTPVNLSLLKKIADSLIVLHSQHQSLALKQTKDQVLLLDNFCQHAELLEEFKHNYKQLSMLKKEFIELKERENISQNELEFLSFQLEELEQANLQLGELENIESELSLLNNAEKIAQTLEKGSYFLKKDFGILQLLSEISKEFSGIAQINTSIETISNRLYQSMIELKDIEDSIALLQTNLMDESPQKDKLNFRLNTINSLLLKHKKKLVEELIELKSSLQTRKDKFENREEAIVKKQEEIQKMEEKAWGIAECISQNRRSISKDLQSRIEGKLKELGMPYATFVIAIKEMDNLQENGMNEIEFLFSANKGRKAELLGSIISGGELSRLMLAIQNVSTNFFTTNTLIFDEIDSGVSGEIANKMGEMMKTIAIKNQVITVTHLPQVAARGEHHFMIFKELNNGLTFTKIKMLDQTERVEEIAKLLSGKEITSISKQNALELLNQ